LQLPKDEQVTATTSVLIGYDNQRYTRTASVPAGMATICVTHPGEYTVGDQTVAVSSEDVPKGNQTAISVG